MTKQTKRYKPLCWVGILYIHIYIRDMHGNLMSRNRTKSILIFLYVEYYYLVKSYVSIWTDMVPFTALWLKNNVAPLRLSNRRRERDIKHISWSDSAGLSP